MNLAGGEGARERAVTPAEHGQERWTIYPCGCGAVGGNPSFERAVPCGRRSDGFHDAKPVEVVLADRERALVEALREIAHWDYGGQALRCNEMAQAALDRIGEGR
jgi:hypothetical protein